MILTGPLGRTVLMELSSVWIKLQLVQVSPCITLHDVWTITGGLQAEQRFRIGIELSSKVNL